jgi:hypothetical protein
MGNKRSDTISNFVTNIKYGILKPFYKKLYNFDEDTYQNFVRRNCFIREFNKDVRTQKIKEMSPKRYFKLMTASTLSFKKLLTSRQLNMPDYKRKFDPANIVHFLKYSYEMTDGTKATIRCSENKSSEEAIKDLAMCEVRTSNYKALVSGKNIGNPLLFAGIDADCVNDLMVCEFVENDYKQSVIEKAKNVKINFEKHTKEPAPGHYLVWYTYTPDEKIVFGMSGVPIKSVKPVEYNDILELFGMTDLDLIMPLDLEDIEFLDKQSSI